MVLSRTSTKIVSNVLLAGLLLSCTEPIFAKYRTNDEEYERETQAERWGRIILYTGGAIVVVCGSIYCGFRIKDAYEGWQRRAGDISNLTSVHNVDPDTAARLVAQHGPVCTEAVRRIKVAGMDIHTATDFVSQCAPSYTTHFLNLVAAGIPAHTATRALRDLGPDCVPDLVELVRAPIAEAAGNVAAAQNIMLTPGTALAALTACKGNPVKLLELKVAALDPRKLTIFATKLGEKDHELAIQAAQMQPIADLAAKLDECARSLAALSEKQDATATAAASNTDRIMGAINTTAASRK